jgi:hypothetical protein
LNLRDELYDSGLVQGGFLHVFEENTNLNFIGGVVRKVVRGMDSIVAGPNGRGAEEGRENDRSRHVCLVRTAFVWLTLRVRMDSSLSLSTPDAFPIFPYDEPYHIQLDLMQHLYRAIEDKAVVVVESPTGTVNFQNAFQGRHSDDVSPG